MGRNHRHTVIVDHLRIDGISTWLVTTDPDDARLEIVGHQDLGYLAEEGVRPDNMDADPVWQGLWLQVALP